MQTVEPAVQRAVGRVQGPLLVGLRAVAALLLAVGLLGLAAAHARPAQLDDLLGDASRGATHEVVLDVDGDGASWSAYGNRWHLDLPSASADGRTVYLSDLRRELDSVQLGRTVVLHDAGPLQRLTRDALLVGALVAVGLFVFGPQPWRATRWAWFWLATSLAYGGALAFLLLAGPFPRVRPPRRRRMTGGEAFVLSLVAAVVVDLVRWLLEDRFGGPRVGPSSYVQVS